MKKSFKWMLFMCFGIIMMAGGGLLALLGIVWFLICGIQTAYYIALDK